MKILYICRLYTGFEQSLRSGVWQPAGAPTIAKMISHLDHHPHAQLSVVLTYKDYNGTWGNTSDRTYNLEGLSVRPLVLAGAEAFPTWLGRMRPRLRDLRHFYACWRLYRQFKPDLIYCDRVNLPIAAFFSRFTRTPVIWRIMGILEDMRTDLKSGSWRSRFYRYLYRSPFAAAICTLDGSGGGLWMKAALRPGVPAHLLINGVDFATPCETVAGLDNITATKVLFAGRLEELKGALEYTRALIDVIKQGADFHAVIAGEGSLRDSLETLVQAQGLSGRFSFLGSISPAQLEYVRNHCDIYVSLNKQGNLSNVNLEALADGMFCIMPKAQPQIGIDTDTDLLIPEDACVRFGAVDDIEALKVCLLTYKDEAARTPFRARAQALSKTILPSWENRIAQEISIYNSLVHPSDHKGGAL